MVPERATELQGAAMDIGLFEWIVAGAGSVVVLLLSWTHLRISEVQRGSEQRDRELGALVEARDQTTRQFQESVLRELGDCVHKQDLDPLREDIRDLRREIAAAMRQEANVK